MIPHNKPTLDEKEIEAIQEVILSGWVANGEKVKNFERDFCKYLGFNSNCAVAVSSGTAGLFLALKAIGVGENDEVILPTYVCSAVLNAIYMAQAKPILVDIDDKDFNISFDLVNQLINQRTKALIIPHTYGVPIDIHRIKNIGIPIIEDCAQAIGSKIGDDYAGTIGDISVFSFYATKVITTGNGGMVLTQRKEYIDRLKDYLDFDYRENYYPRFNFLMSDIQGAMGISQLGKLDYLLKKREEIADCYMSICQEKGWDFQRPRQNTLKQNHYRFVIKSESSLINKLKDYLDSREIRTIIPIEKKELLHNYLGLDSSRFYVSQKIAETTLSLPAYPQLVVNGDIEKIVDVLRGF